MQWYFAKFFGVLFALFALEMTVRVQRAVMEPWTTFLASISVPLWDNVALALTILLLALLGSHSAAANHHSRRR